MDRQTETVTVAPPPPDVAAMAGAEIFIANSDRRVAYKVLQARAVSEGVELRLNWDSRIGVGRSTGAADHKIRTNSPFMLHRFRYYDGARLTNADRTAEYRIVEARSGKAVFLDSRTHAQAKADKLAREFPVDSWFEIHDYGVGDDVEWPYAVSVTREPSGQYRIQSPVPVKVDLAPQGRGG